MAASSSDASDAGLSPLGFRHPPRYQKWLERARAAYNPPEPIEGASGSNSVLFASWLCDSIGGLVYQVAAEVNRLRISMSDGVFSNQAHRNNACRVYDRDYDLWSVDGEGTKVMAVGEDSRTEDDQRGLYYKTENLLSAYVGYVDVGMSFYGFYVHFDFQAAMADLTHELSPWGDPFLTRGRKESRSTSGVPDPYGGPPTKYWTASSSFEFEAKRYWLASGENELRDLVFAVKWAREGGTRLELAFPKEDKVKMRMSMSSRRVFDNGDPTNYRLILIMPSVRHQRLFAIGRIQRWWRQVRQKLA